MVILEADRFFRIIDHPAREKDGAVKEFVTQVYDQTDVGPGRFGPRNFINALPHPHNIGPLIFHPTIPHNTAVNAVIQRSVVFHVDLVIPAIIVDQMFADKSA